MRKKYKICIITHTDKMGREAILSCHRSADKAFDQLLKYWSTDGTYTTTLIDGFRVRTLRAYLQEKTKSQVALFCAMLKRGTRLDSVVHKYLMYYTNETYAKGQCMDMWDYLLLEEEFVKTEIEGTKHDTEKN